MKNIFLVLSKLRKLVLISFLILIIFITSCKDIIDLKPYSSISESTAFSTPSLIDLSVTGMYQAAQIGNYGGGNRGYPFGAAFVEQGDCRGEDVVNTQAFYQFTYEGVYNLTSANNSYYWIDSYRLINRANIVIEGVTQAITGNIITAAQGNIYIAEAKFFRAITHLELLFHFALPYKATTDASHMGVPFREKAYVTLGAIDEGTTQHRNTVAECYSKIIADLDFAEANLPGKSVRSGNLKLVRATKGQQLLIKQGFISTCGIGLMSLQKLKR
jgi:hypothetical protein